jgi:DNA-binding XRE family transcriptional regulator
MTIIQYNSGKATMLRHGWQTKTAKRMRVCGKTIYNIIEQGEKHPRYAEMIKIARNLK